MLEYSIVVYRNGDQLPVEAEQLFEKELAESRQPLPEDRADKQQWHFACVCAVDDAGHVLGGVHFDYGPLGFGPLRDDKVAYLERTFVREQYRRQGIAIQLLWKALAVAREAGCQHMRVSASWENPAEIALYKKCRFALVDINEPGEGGEYFVVKPLAE